MLTIVTCAIPLVTGLLAFLFLRKGDGERRVRNALWLTFSAISIPWLCYVWRSMVDSPKEIAVFFWTLLIFFPIWVGWEVLANMGEKYANAGRIVLFLGMAPIFLFVICDIFTFLEGWVVNYEMELIANTLMFGGFWILGLWAREYEIVLFRENPRAG